MRIAQGAHYPTWSLATRPALLGTPDRLAANTLEVKDQWRAIMKSCERFDRAVMMSSALLKQRIQRNPDTDASRVLFAASYGQMGLIKEARKAWREALQINLAYSLERRRKVLPYKNSGDFDLVIEGLRKAGIEQ